MGTTNKDFYKGLKSHSKAKVTLYKTYLARYLNIIARNKYVGKIYLYDLLCGKGKYDDGEDGIKIQ